MCGIIGYTGRKNATGILLDGLKRLEYRGYDSAGVAVLQNGEIAIRRASGKLGNLEALLKTEAPRGTLGIGHTRWATHGRPSETNAHPHKAGKIVLVHNGIVENYPKIREYLIRKGHTIKSETDTEVICHLIQQRIYDGLSMPKAFLKTISEIQGSYALVVMNEDEKEKLYVARKGSPLVIGLGKGENLVASDIPALLPYTRRVLFLEDEEWGVITPHEVHLFNCKGRSVNRHYKEISWNQSMAEKGGYKHFMQKEIFEQPRSVIDTLAGRISKENGKVVLNDLAPLFPKGSFPYDKVYIIACGTSYHAGLVGKYWLEEFCRFPVMVDQASEFRYRHPIVDKKTLVVAISQSGETADTLAAVKDVKREGAKVLSICNILDSSLARVSDATLYTHAGPEIGVASTKAFTTQMIVLFLFSLYVGKLRKNLDSAFLKKAVKTLVHLPHQMEKVLKSDAAVRKIAVQYAESPNALYFARGLSYPVALEGALKLKEISYIHAEGYSAGEMKHGPIALIENGMPVVALAPRDAHYEKVRSNIEEVRARGADIIAVATEGDKTIADKASQVIFIPKVEWYANPFLTVLPLQMLAYHVADHKGTDVDQPRNLAKSVTVE